jgi:CRISPR-associated protein Cas2
MLVLITYDVNVQTPEGRARLRKTARLCQNHGQRVQNSVFECVLAPGSWEHLRHELESLINPETDSLRYYFLGKNWRRRVEHVGAKPSYDPEASIVI